jgi:hypothetical protein
MGKNRFIASAQYDNLKGGAAADRADKNSSEEWLQANGHKKENEFLLGITLHAGENHGVHKDPVYVDFLLATPGDHDSVKAMIDSAHGPVEVRKVSVSMNLVDFFGLFKRFSVTLSTHGMLGEREYTYFD